MVFVRFFGEVRKTKIAFEINWPLVMAQNVKISVSGFYWFCKKKNSSCWNSQIRRFFSSRTRFSITIPILFNLFQPSIDCSLVNSKFLELFECIFLFCFDLILQHVIARRKTWTFCKKMSFSLYKSPSIEVLSIAR